MVVYSCFLVHSLLAGYGSPLAPKVGTNAPLQNQKQTAAQAKSVHQIFDYYDQYVARYKKKDIDAITVAWAPGYKDRFGDTMPSSSDTPELAGKERLLLQMNYSGRFSNGPDLICATKITETSTTVTVVGYRAGNYKYLNADGTLQMGGSSFSNVFTDTWSQKGGVWLLSKTVHGKYVEDSDEQFASAKKAHEALRSQYSKS